MSDEFILLTGGSGFIGSHLVEELIKRGRKLLILTRPNTNLLRLQKLESKFRSISYADFFNNKENIELEGVIHLATNYKRSHDFSDIENIINSNITVPTQVVEKACNIYGARYVLNTGTFFRYKLTRDVIDEDTEVKPYNFYASTKVSFEKVLDFYCLERGIRAISLILFSPYGPMDNPNKLIPLVIKNTLNGRKMALTDGIQRLDFTFITDIIDAYVKSIEYLRNSMESGHDIVNIGSGRNYSVMEVVSEIERLIGKTLTKSWDKKSIDSFRVLSSNKKAENKIGWFPKWDITHGLEKTIEYYKGE